MAGNNLRVNVTADASQHNAELNRAASQVDRLAAQTRKAQKDMKDFNTHLTGVAGGVGNMFSAISRGDFAGFVGGAASARSALTAMQASMGGVTKMGPMMGAALHAALGPIGLITGAIGLIGGVTYKAITAANEFEVSLDQLSSLTGAAGDDLKAMSDGAMEMSSKYGIAASSIVDSMKNIGSQAPELLKDKEGLMEVTEAANILAQAGGMKVEDAARSITNAMNQMGVKASESKDVINMFAAASQAGSADIEWLSKTLEKCGTMATMSGMGLKDLTAAAETIAPKFASSEQAGESLKGVLRSLVNQSNDEFKPAVVGLDKALENLANANLSSAEMIKMFGSEGLTAAQALIEGRDAVKEFGDKITGTNTAIEMAQTNTDNWEGSMNRMKQTIQNAFIQMGQSEGIQNMIKGLGTVVQIVADCVVGVIELVSEFMNLAPVQAIIKAVQFNLELVWKALKFVIDWLVKVFKKWNAVFNDIKNLVFRIVNAIKNAFMQFIRPVIEGVNKLWNSFKNTSAYKFIVNLCNKIKDAFLKVIKACADVWDDFMDWLGIDSLKINFNVTPIKEEKIVPDEVHTTVVLDEDPIKDNSGGGGGSKSGGSKSGKTTKVEVKPDEGSLAALEAQLKKITDELHNTKPSPERLKTLLAEKANLEEQIKKTKELIGEGEKVKVNPQPAKGSIADLEATVSKLNKELNETQVSDARLKEILKEKKELEEQIKLLKERNGLAEVKPVVNPESLQGIQDKLSKAKTEFNLEPVGTEKYNELAKLIAELTDKEHKIQLKMDEDSMSDLEKAKKNLDEYIEATNKTAETIGSVGSAFSALGSAVGGTTGEMLNMFGSIAGGIAQLIPQIVTLITAKNAEAIATGTASGAAMPFPANIAAIASIVATIAGIFASLPIFANGGVINGATSIGDYNLARVNGGEMILNGGQQKRLFNMLNHGGFGEENSGPTSYTVKIKGSDLHIAFNNYKKMKKGLL